MLYRSLEAIAEQAKCLAIVLEDTLLMPDFIAVIGQGIIGNRMPLRGECNQYKPVENFQELVELRKTGRHTLLRLDMQILRELNTITLRPLDLHDYDNMPRLIGKYRVRKRNRLIRTSINNSSDSKVAVKNYFT